MKKLEKTSVQLSPEILKWLDSWPGLTRSEAIRLVLDRAAYSRTLMEAAEDVVLKYYPILSRALEDFPRDSFRTVARVLPTIVLAYTQEKEGNRWVDQVSGDALEPHELYAKLEQMHAVERIYVLDRIVERREWPESELVEVPGTKTALKR